MSKPSTLRMVTAALLVIAVVGVAVEANPTSLAEEATPQAAKIIFADVEKGRVAKEMQLEKQLIPPNPAKTRKDFFLSNYIKSTWLRAYGHCAMHGMQLATFDSEEQYSKFVDGLAKTHVSGEFWIAVTKLGDSRLNFFPTFAAITAVYKDKITGAGDCVYIKVENNPTYKVTWMAAECSSITDQKSFVCQSNPDADRLFYRL